MRLSHYRIGRWPRRHRPQTGKGGGGSRVSPTDDDIGYDRCEILQRLSCEVWRCSTKRRHKSEVTRGGARDGTRLTQHADIWHVRRLRCLVSHPNVRFRKRAHLVLFHHERIRANVNCGAHSPEPEPTILTMLEVARFEIEGQPTGAPPALCTAASQLPLQTLPSSYRRRSYPPRWPHVADWPGGHAGQLVVTHAPPQAVTGSAAQHPTINCSPHNFLRSMGNSGLFMTKPSQHRSLTLARAPVRT